MTEEAKRTLNNAGFRVSLKSSVNGFILLDVGFCEIGIIQQYIPKKLDELLDGKPIVLLLPNEAEKEKFRKSRFYSQTILMPELLPTIQKQNVINSKSCY
jgi:hypothetical protein